MGKWKIYRDVLSPLLYERIDNKLLNSKRLAFKKIKDISLKNNKYLSKGMKILLDKYFSNINKLMCRSMKINALNDLKDIYYPYKVNNYINIFNV